MTILMKALTVLGLMFIRPARPVVLFVPIKLYVWVQRR
jgi:hypothetical protein